MTRFSTQLNCLVTHLHPRKSSKYPGCKNICEIGKERIRCAGKKIKEENLQATDLDIGFRAFELDDSNMKDVYYFAGEYSQIFKLLTQDTRIKVI